MNEGETGSIRITLSEPAHAEVEIGYAIARIDASGDGLLSTDIGNLGGLAVIPVGQSQVDIAVPTLVDGLDEPDEAFAIAILTITNATVDATAGSHILTVIDVDEPPSISFASARTAVDETSGSVSIPVTLSVPSGRPILLRVSINRATARIGSDIGPAALDLAFAPGEITAQAKFAIYDDDWREGIESAWLDVALLNDAAPLGNIVHRIDIRSDERDSMVARWLERACAQVAIHHTDPPAAARIYALVGAAQRRGLHDLAAVGDQSSTSEAGVVASASVAVLSGLYPDVATTLATMLSEDSLDAGWSGFPNEPLGAESVGGRAAAAILAEAAGDGAIDYWTSVPPTTPGSWYASWSYPQPPLRPWWGGVRPWFLTSGSALRPEPPPTFGSGAFLAAVSEVRAISDNRSDEQVVIAAKWSDGPGTSTPAGHWVEELAALLRARSMDESAGAESAALLGAVMHDAAVACWDAKYAYWLLRPYQADRSILSSLGQPNFPSYVSGHATF
ncbi:MAG TPA: Calx-beta domain-containing protein, partial [Sphingomonas sp.]